MHNFWKTWEVTSICMALKYEEYVEHHPGPNHPLSYESWCILAEAVETQMEKDLA